MFVDETVIQVENRYKASKETNNISKFKIDKEK